MWNMISDQSSWGGFASRMKELAENKQRPGGQEVFVMTERGTEQLLPLRNQRHRLSQASRKD